MQLVNSPGRYGAVSIALHWLAAASVLTLLYTGLRMWLAPDHAAYLPWVKIHSRFGILVWLVLAVRVTWHFISPQPDKLSRNVALNRLATGVHTALLLLILLQMITGPVDIWSGGFKLHVTDGFSLPSLMGKTSKATHDLIGQFHGLTGATIGLLLALHLAGVAKHVLIDRDGTLRRMLGLAGSKEALDERKV